MFKSTMLLLMYSGGSRGAPPLFLEHTEVQRAEKNFLETAPPPPLFQGLDPARMLCVNTSEVKDKKL